jgi:uncharacterized protein YdaU (DUF1376 family)
MAGYDLPWFKMYAAETLSDENFLGWSVEERGAWITLLCHQWREGSIPADLDRIACLLRLDADAMRPQCERIWRRIADRFIPHPDLPGRLVSPRMEMEREEAMEVAKQKSDAAKKAATSRWSKGNRPHATAMRPHSDRNAPAMRPHAIQIQPSPEPEQSQPAIGLAGEERRLLVFRETLGERLGLPGPVGIGGDDPAAVVAFFLAQREAVGDEPLLTECCDLAAKSTTGVPTTLAWFVGWFKKLPVPKAQAVNAAVQ